jgi:hypothetical protein
LVWAGGLLGRAMAQGAYWGAQPLGRLAQAQARARERRQNRRAAARMKPAGEGAVDRNPL